MHKHMVILLVVAALGTGMLPADAWPLSLGAGSFDRPGAPCAVGGGCILPGANPNDYWHVPHKECYPPANAYRFPSWRTKHNRCFCAEDFYTGAALLPGDLTEWYGNPYDGF